MSGQTWQIAVDGTSHRAIDLLAEHTGLSRQRLKDALAKGAVWLRRGSHEERLRRATRVLQAGDSLILHYDPDVLQRQPRQPLLIADEGAYSVWDKPAGMLAQGTRYGDHCALLRWSETAFTAARPAFLVHRLDREASGLMVIAHSQRAARALSQLWQSGDSAVRKVYKVTVEGIVGPAGSGGRIEQALDGKASVTEYTVLETDAAQGRSVLEVRLLTGRKHQIRRHVAGLGHPVVGDYRYGRGGEPLQLRAVALAFRCPLTGRPRDYRAPAEAAGA